MSEEPEEPKQPGQPGEAAGFIYRVCPAADWQAARRAGVYRGAAHDRADGFLHFSTAAQLAGTLAAHYAGRADLLLLCVPVAALEALPDAALRWEASRGGALFPISTAPCLPARWPGRGRFHSGLKAATACPRWPPEAPGSGEGARGDGGLRRWDCSTARRRPCSASSTRRRRTA